MPSFSAVASTNGLNDDPGWRSPCTARLNWLVWKLRPPYIASTAPVEGLIATSAACGPVVLGSHLSTAARASFCSLRSIVVSTRKPPPNTRFTPSSSMSCDLTYSPKYGDWPITPERCTFCGFGIGACTAFRNCPLVMSCCCSIRRSTSARRAFAVSRVRDGVVQARILGNPGEERGLRERQFERAVSEVRERGALDAVRAVPEVDRVQVRGKDLVLRPLLLELPRERRLLELARDGRRVAGQLVLHELLRDRRASLHGRLVPDVGPERTAHAADVDSAVLVEPLVLCRDDRLLDPRRDLLAVHEHAALAAAQHRENRVAVARVDVAVHLLPRRLLERIEPGQLLADGEDQPVRERSDREDAQDADEGEKAELADPAPGPARSRRLRAFSTEQHGRARF